MRFKGGFVLNVFFILLVNVTFSNDTVRYLELYKNALQSDSSRVNELTQCYLYFESEKDTLWIIRSLVGLAIHESKDGNYVKAFSHLWEGLLYAEEYHDILLLYDVHTQLGRLYNIYDKNKEAFEHEKKVLKYAKIGYETGKLSGRTMVSAYFNMVLFYRKIGDYQQSLNYLDSCYQYANLMNYTNDEMAYLKSEEGQILLRRGNTDEALERFNELKNIFERINPGYLSIIYSYLGSTYEARGEWEKASLYFQKSIENVDLRKAHYDVKAESLDKLASNLARQNKYAEAYEILRKAKVLNEELFSTKGLQNQNLLSIRNLYREEVAKRDRIILERDKELIAQKAGNMRIRSILIGIIALVIVFVLVLYIRYNKRKLIAEKENQRIKSKMEQEKNRALVEMKNRELTSFTLRLIDKDAFINDLIGAINQYAPSNEALLKKVKLGSTGRMKLWNEFDKRFVDVNKGFYEKLKTGFPDLTPTELKHCALIKLNFSAKEMAQLLNISINGANTSRYRIRKKLGLEREENLAKFIDQIN